MAELALILRRPIMAHPWNATLDEIHEARERRPTKVRVDLAALDLVVRRLENSTPVTDTEIINLVHALGSVFEVNQIIAEPLRLVK